MKDLPDYTNVGLKHRDSKVFIERNCVYHQFDAFFKLLDISEHNQRVQWVNQGQGKTENMQLITSVMRVGSDTFGAPIFQNGLQN